MREQLRTIEPNRLLKKASRTALATLAIGAMPAAVAAKASTKPKEGVDISYNQGGKSPLPEKAGFFIVGINGKLPNEFNPHFKQEWSWGKKITGKSTWPALSAFVTIANPGDIKPRVPDWPGTGKTPPGKCNGSDSIVCAYEFGENKAKADIASIDPVRPSKIWVDIEPEYSWSKDLAKNAAAVNGMISVFSYNGIESGLYFQTTELEHIVGPIAKNSPLHGFPEWLLGATSLNGQFSAEKNCRVPSVTGGPVELAQIASPNQIDRDIFC